MAFNSQIGLVFYRTPETLFLPFYDNPNGRTWNKRMMPNGGNRFGIQGKLGHRIESYKLSKLNFS
tara:strand:- start:112 stop:306 length:195 start_codon:yes stop_codon:yes gene_type:complete